MSLYVPNRTKSKAVMCEFVFKDQGTIIYFCSKRKPPLVYSFPLLLLKDQWGNLEGHPRQKPLDSSLTGAP